MADIFIDRIGGKLSVKIEVKSLQVVGYSGQLIGADHKVVAEFDGSLGSTTDSATNVIGIDAASCIDGFINSIIEIADPIGADQNYDINISVFQDNLQLTPIISLTGTTTNNDVTRYPQFHINAKQ